MLRRELTSIDEHAVRRFMLDEQYGTHEERSTFKGEWRHAAGIAVIFCYFARSRQNCLRAGLEVAEAGKTDAELRFVLCMER